MINKCLFFDISAAKSVDNLDVGREVMYLAYKLSDDFPVKIIKILEVVDNKWEEPSEQEMNQIIEELRSEKPEIYKTQIQTMLGYVASKRKQFLCIEINNDAIDVDLDTVQTSFLPHVGDHLVLECRAQRDESYVNLVGDVIEVVSIHPNRSKNLQGTISSIDETRKCGVIDRKYFFYFDALDMEYLRPQVGEIVVCDVMESDQGEFKWRCIKVVLMEALIDSDPDLRQPNVAINNNKRIIRGNGAAATVNSQIVSTLMKNKHGIEIEDNLYAKFSEIGEKTVIKMEVKNTSDRTHKILQSFFQIDKKNSQLELLKPKRYDQIVVQPNESFEYELEAVAKYYGQSSEVFTITFAGQFKIGRKIEISVLDETGTTPSMGTGKNLYRNTGYTSEVWKKQRDIIPGVGFNKRCNFIAVKFDSYDVPNALKSAILNLYTMTEINERLDYILPFFSEPLSIKNYEKCFHNLLYLEEIQLYHNIRRYDMDRAHFIKEGEYLSLHVPNMAETRPSLVLGK